MKKDYPSYSKIDEILYYLAYEYEQNKDLDHARAVYLELIEKAPNSPYIPNAYLAFGELFFVEAMGDPSKWELAAQAYKEVIKYKPPQNKVWGYAQYKLGYVYWNSGDYAQAIQQFKNVIEYGDKFADLPSAKLLQKSARRDILPVYAVAGKPSKAYNFFRPLSGDSGNSQEQTLQMLRDLGVNYYDTGHYDEAITLYRDLSGGAHQVRGEFPPLDGLQERAAAAREEGPKGHAGEEAGIGRDVCWIARLAHDAPAGARPSAADHGDLRSRASIQGHAPPVAGSRAAGAPLGRRLRRARVRGSARQDQGRHRRG
jgi:tetratricopeptide (TPR) repeat protein